MFESSGFLVLLTSGLYVERSTFNMQPIIRLNWDEKDEAWARGVQTFFLTLKLIPGTMYAETSNLRSRGHINK